MAQYQSAIFKIAAAGCLLANYGRYKLGVEIKDNLQERGQLQHESADNWLGYRPNALTALHGFYQGFWYYFGMGIFYYHMSKRRGKLSQIELVGLLNQALFHLSSVFEFRGLSQKVSFAFMAAVIAGTGCQIYGI